MRRTPLLLAALAVVAAALVPVQSAHAASIPDPLALGPYSVYQTDYDTGTANAALVGGEDGLTPFLQEMDGDLFIPSGPGPFPVLVFEHGRHATCEIAGQFDELGNPCPTTPVTADIQSFRGYDYLGQNLASHGYIVISLDANAVNSYDLTAQDEGAAARAQLISKTLDLLSTWNTTAGPTGVDSRLIGKVDLTRIGVMGHSRGGEGANRFVTYNQTRPATAAAALAIGDPDFGPRYPGVKAVFALAPIDAEDESPTGVALGTLVPYCDGDVSDLAGTRPFEREVSANSAAGFPSVLFGVQGADHDYYNTVWTSDDDSGDPDSACGTGPASIRLTPTEQRATALTIIGGFFRRYVGGEMAFDPLVTGATHLPADACPTAHAVPCDQEVQTSYVAPKAQRHVLVTPGATSDVATTTTGFTTAAVCTPNTSGVGCPATATTTDPAFTDRSTTAQEHLVFDGPATFTAQLGGQDASAYGVLTIRSAADYLDTTRNPQGVTQDYTVTLTDASGASSTVDASPYAAGTLVPERFSANADNPEMVLGDVRIPLTAFGGIDLTKLTTLTLGFGTLTPRGNIDIAGIAFQEPAAAAPATPLPEAGVVVLLPIVALAVGGALAVTRRRRARLRRG